MTIMVMWRRNYAYSPELGVDFSEKQVHNGGMMTNWPNVEVRLRGVLDAFQECAGFTPRDRLRGEWIAGARNFVENVGERPDLIKPSVEYMQKHDMLIKSPGSLVTIALKMRGKRVGIHEVCPECGAAFGTHSKDCEVA